MIAVTSGTGRLVVTLARPEKANALTADMLKDLVDLVRGATERDVNALILTGEGKVFSAGADLDEVRSGDLAINPHWEALSAAVAESPLLTVAAMNGSCAGGAMGMVLACDFRVAAPEAAFFYPVMKMGVLPQPSDPARLAALVGPARAKLILLGGARLGAEEARSFGLIDRISDDPMGEAVDLTEAAARADRDRVAAIKTMVSPR